MNEIVTASAPLCAASTDRPEPSSPAPATTPAPTAAASVKKRLRERCARVLITGPSLAYAITLLQVQ